MKFKIGDWVSAHVKTKNTFSYLGDDYILPGYKGVIINIDFERPFPYEIFEGSEETSFCTEDELQLLPEPNDILKEIL